MPRILIVEDDYDTSLALSTELRGAGFEVVIAGDGPTALQRAQPDISLVLLDIRLPKKDGWWVLEEIRKSDKQTPIMMLTSLGREDDVVRGLDRGANDYLTKPFRKKELLARIHALIRRTDGPEDTVFSFGNVQGDLARRKVHVDGITVELTSLEWKFLEAFLKSKGRLLSREQLLNRAEIKRDSGPRVVDFHIMGLRNKLGLNTPKTQHIVTVIGDGYRFDRNPRS